MPVIWRLFVKMSIKHLEDLIETREILFIILAPPGETPGYSAAWNMDDTAAVWIFAEFGKIINNKRVHSVVLRRNNKIVKLCWAIRSILIEIAFGTRRVQYMLSHGSH